MLVKRLLWRQDNWAWLKRKMESSISKMEPVVPPERAQSAPTSDGVGGGHSDDARDSLSEHGV